MVVVVDLTEVADGLDMASEAEKKKSRLDGSECVAKAPGDAVLC